MADQFRITGRPELPSRQGGDAAPAVLARVPGIGPLAGSGGDNRLQGLIEGLQSFNPALQQWGQRQQQEQHQAAVDQANADAQRVEQPVDALTGAPVARPSTVPPAYDAEYRRAYGIALAQRAALDTRQQMATAYEDEKNGPDFNVDAFLKGWREKSLQGVKDPLLQGAIGAHLGEVESGIRSDYTNLVVQRHEQNRMATAFQLADGFTADQTPQELGQKHLDWYVPQLSAMQVDKKQATQLFLGKINALSAAGGGRPELYDAFNEKDGEGLSILARNPQLAPHILEAKQQAQAQHDRALHQATEVDRFKTDTELGDDVMRRPESVTVDRLASMVGPNGLSAEKAASYYHEAQVALGKKQAMGSMMADAERGMLGYYHPDDQRKVLDARLGPVAQQMWTAASQGDAQSVAALAGQLMSTQSRYKATIPVETLARLVETTVSALPNPQGPDAGFTASAAVYQALAADPQYRDLYFKGDAAKVMEAYTRRASTGVDAKTAYDAAYRTIDPDVQALARKRADAPDMQAKIAKTAAAAAQGSSLFPRWMGGNGRPQNPEAMGLWASGVVRQAMTDNPDISDSDLKDLVDREAARNWAMDTTSRLAVKIPPGTSGNVPQAISEFSQDMGEMLRKKGQFPDGAVIRYVPLDDKGTYRVQAWNGTKTTDLSTVTVNDMLTRNSAKHVMTAQEGAQVVAWKQALAKGQDVPNLDPALLAKASSTGLLTGSEQQEIQSRNAARVLARLQQVPNMGLGTPTGTYTEVPKHGNAVIDNQLTSSVALDLFNNAGLTGGPLSGTTDNGLGLAASLTAMREGVALRAYADPAKGAGMNIGAGYNLNAHKDVVNADLKRAGVPEDRIEDVKAGRAQLTGDQVKRLTQVSLTRYAADTQKAAEAAAPGLWERMLPAQRAVMIDLAYQTGNADQFHKAWAALQKGDTDAFAKEIKVTYVNHAGDRVEDTRATDLRASLLNGASYWKSRLSIAGSRPSNPIQSAAQLASK